jgi:hypothetical protein
MSSIRRVVTKNAAVSGSFTQSLGAVTEGDLLLTWLVGYNRVPVDGDVEDDINGSWGEPLISWHSPVNSAIIGLFAFRDSAAGTPTLTVNNSSYYVAFPYVIIANATCNIQLSELFDDPVDDNNDIGFSASGPIARSGPVTPVAGPYVAIGGFTINAGNPTYTPKTGWTLGEAQYDYNGAYQPGGCEHIESSTIEELTSEVTFSASNIPWLSGLVVISDGDEVETPDIYMVMGGTEEEGWFGHEGKGGADSTADIVFPEEIQIGWTLEVALIVYGATPTLAEVSDDGGNTWVIHKQEAHNAGGGDGNGGSVTILHCEVTNPLTVFNYDATSLPAGNAGRYGQLGAFVFKIPDDTNGFATVTPISNSQFNVSAVTPGSRNPDTNKTFWIFAGCNRGHTENLKPFTKPSGYVDADLIHSGIDGDGAESAVHNSITQSGWWFGKLVDGAFTVENPSFGFATTTGECHSVLAGFNIEGGSLASGNLPSVFKSRILSSRVFRR